MEDNKMIEALERKRAELVKQLNSTKTIWNEVNKTLHTLSTESTNLQKAIWAIDNSINAVNGAYDNVNEDFGYSYDPESR